MAGWEFWLVATAAAVAVGLSKGGLPAVGMLAVPVLALALPPVTAAGLLLPVYVLSDMLGLVAYRRGFDRRLFAILAPPMTFGILLGWYLAAAVPDRLVTGVIGAIGLLFSAWLVLARRPQGPPLRPRLVPGLFWGAVAGFTSFVSHAGGPPYQVYVLPLRLSKIGFAATTTVVFAYVNAVKLVPYWALGQLSPANLRVAAVLFVPAGLAVLAGVWLVRVLPERWFFGLVTAALAAVSLRHLWTALAG